MTQPLEHETRPTSVILGVTGGIGAYKACELARALMREGCRVHVVMTQAATRFVTPLTFRSLTGEPVGVSLWDESEARVQHIGLAQEADVMVVAPCTANVLAKLTHGRADDLLTTVALATDAPLVVAPAMNVRMWRREVTQRNAERLRSRGVVFVEPGSGELACGDVGEGRLAPVEEIAAAVLAEARRSRDLVGSRVLVTAGGTREPIDAVRYIGNRSSGRTGFAIAEEAARRGATVTLVSAPVELADPPGVDVVRVETALQMRDAVLAAFDAADAVVMTAAVADVRPESAAEGKVKKDRLPDDVRLVRNPDILADLGERRGLQVLVGFAAETSDVVENARCKLGTKNVDLVVANDVSAPGLGFGAETNRVWFVTAEEVEELPILGKREIARRLLDRVARLLARHHHETGGV